MGRSSPAVAALIIACAGVAPAWAQRAGAYEAELQRRQLEYQQQQMLRAQQQQVCAHRRHALALPPPRAAARAPSFSHLSPLRGGRTDPRAERSAR